MAKRWSKEEVKILLSNKYTEEEIAKMTGRSKEAVMTKLYEIYIKGKKPVAEKKKYGVINKKTDELLFSGTIDEVAEFVGLSTHAVYSAIYISDRKGRKCKYVRLSA